MKWIYSKGRGFRLELSDRMIVWVVSLAIFAAKGDEAIAGLAVLIRFLAPGASLLK